MFCQKIKYMFCHNIKYNNVCYTMGIKVIKTMSRLFKNIPMQGFKSFVLIFIGGIGIITTILNYPCNME